MVSSNSKRITRNAVALTFRMILVTLVGLYTSRVILEALGVDDYGIYGVIGGVVGLAGFLNSSMAGATSRFITFELGRENDSELKSVFSTSLVIHLGLALIVLILAETVGLWFVNYKMNFPADRMVAVNALYQFSIFSMVVSFTQVPYTATIIAHEKMNIYAYLEVVNVVLKLAAIYMVMVMRSDSLILYGALILCVTTLIAALYRIYCIKHFPEARSGLMFKKDILRKMVAFSGYDLYGNMCGAVKYQGLPLILNLFFGVVANAGASIANSVAVAVKNFTTTIFQAFRPQIIKQYAAGEIAEMSAIMLKANQFTLLAFSAVAIPVFLEAEYIIDIWLGQVPPYAVIFLRLMILALFAEVSVDINNAGIHATGYVKNISFISGSVYLLCPIVSYVLLRFYTLPASTIYIVNIATMFVVAALGQLFLKIQIGGFQIVRYVFGVLKIIVCVSLAAVSTWLIKDRCMDINVEGLGRRLLQIVIVVWINLAILGSLSMVLVFSGNQRKALLSKVIGKLKIQR